MDSIKVKELLKGIVVIIDDEIDKEESQIFKLIGQIKKNNIPVLSYDRIPKSELVGSLHNASIIILDWKFFPQIDLQMEGDKLYGASSLQEEDREEVIHFIKSVCDTLLVPIFIFTSELVEVVQDALKEHGLADGSNDRIFIENKDKISDLDSLYQRIGTWMMEKPSAYVLKEWDRAFCKARNEMFIEMYSASPEWVRIIWDMIKKDSGGENVNCHREFEDFLTGSIVNRLHDISFDTACLQQKGNKISNEEITKILEAERYIAYEDYYIKEDILPHAGDLFEMEDGTYYLNIRAECNLVRNKDGDIELYCLEGRAIPEKSIALEPIQITAADKLKIGNKEFDFNQPPSRSLKKALESYSKKNNFYHGTIIEKTYEAIVPCIVGKKLMQFNLNIKVKKFSEMKKYLKGKLLPPYLTQVQQRSSHYIVRAGTLPIPSRLFETYDGYC